MRLKTFTGETLPDAMRRVRDKLGSDAVILSTQEDPDGGVRVTAALEDEPAHGSLFDSDAGMEIFHRLNEALDYHRVPTGLADRLVAAAAHITADSATMALAGALDAELRFAAPPQGATPRPLLLLGSPGAGKTATAAKLAAQVRIRGGKATLITLDTGKAGSLAQASAFSQALGAQLRKAHDADSLSQAVAGCPRDHFVVIDTIGASPFDHDALRELSDWIAAGNAEAVLVQQAGGDPLESAEIALAYAEAGARRLVATKLDAARRLGGVLSAAHTAELTLIGVGTAATIGGGLRSINPVQLAKLILPEQGQDEPSPALAHGAGQ